MTIILIILAAAFLERSCDLGSTAAASHPHLVTIRLHITILYTILGWITCHRTRWFLYCQNYECVSNVKFSITAVQWLLLLIPISSPFVIVQSSVG